MEISERLKEGMLDYNSENTSYCEDDVDVCMSKLNEYLEELAKTISKEEAMALVEKAVLQCNELNEGCGHKLIETDQREDICEIIILAGSLMGCNDRDENITEEWREW